MATQSLYRRYRPRRFSELKGQDHIVRALRTSVAEGREGQAYLFSGPRGTGKTTTARIMAKVLNCENPDGGEPCCECASCLSVEQGTSYDVHELDAASNNGVDAMRDLIDKSALGTPGRHKVYILDEVHMLSKGAEAALLKTLEEPPPHVVFVLATTDPQKMSDTIRSRTQHLQFHLLGADTLAEHVRWVASDAGLAVSDDAIEQVIAQGAGSPRDTLSALELASNSGGAALEPIALDEFVEAMIEGDPGRALKMIASAVSRGRDPRAITEELIGFLRNGFLALMAPDLVQVPSQRLDELSDVAQRAGAARLVRGIEMLGEALSEMRNAPDPRVLLDVAAVRLSSDEVGDDVAALAARVGRLERRLAEGSSASATPGSVVAAASPSSAAAPERTVAPDPEPRPAPVDPATGRTKLGARAAASVTTVADDVDDADDAGSVAPSPADPPANVGAQSPDAESGAAQPPESPDLPSSSADATTGVSEADWELVRPQLRGMARAVFSPATLVAVSGQQVTLGLPNDAHRSKCEQHRPAVEKALSAHAGTPIAVELVVAGGDGGPGAGGQPSGVSAGPAGSGGSTGSATRIVDAGVPAAAASSAPGPVRTGAVDGALAENATPSSLTAGPVRAADPVPVADDAEPQRLHVVDGRAIADQARQQGPAPDPEAGLQTHADTLPDDDEVDLDGLVDAPPESVKSPVDRLADAFPGSELVDDPY